MMDAFNERLESFLSEFGKGRKMVLSTSAGDKVTSRMMSVVRIGRDFYFQTDMTMRKYKQLSVNRNAALCIDNIQIEGICRELGHPLDYAPFFEAFRECFRGSFDAYTSLENERLFILEPSYIQRWIYMDTVPYVESFDLAGQSYRIIRYDGR